MKIQANLLTTFHAVGQGLFCSNHINFVAIDEKKLCPFSFVYDCGNRYSIELLRERINQFWELQEYLQGQTDHIDLFVLSHFHVDHYNGLKILLSKKRKNGKNKKIKVVVIPYLEPLESLIIVLEEIQAGNIDISNEDARSQIDFVLNPIDFFKNKAELLILLKSGKSNRSESEDNLKGHEGNKSLDVEFLEEVRKNLKIEKNKTVEVCSSPIAIRRYGLWEIDLLYPKNENLDKKVSDFKGFLFKFFKIEKGDLDIKKIYTAIEVENKKVEMKDENVKFIFEFSDSTLSSISLKELKGLLNKAKICSSQRNDASIICWHFPIDNPKREKSYIHPKHLSSFYGKLKIDSIVWRWMYQENWLDRVAQLYTGDIPFKLLKEVMEDLTKERFILLQVPHHGSGDRNYWDPEILDLESYYWIIPAGVRNTYGHPSLEIVDSILEKGKFPIWVNETNNFQAQAIVEW